MGLIVDEASAEAKSRMALISLSKLILKLMENWRRGLIELTGHPPDYEATMILSAIVVIAGDRLTRMQVEREFQNLANVLPAGTLGKCNISSISTATGLNRETVRRKVKRLEAMGLVRRHPDNSILLSSEMTQSPIAQRIVRAQIDAVKQTVTQLARNQVLVEQPS